jgi:hypothetical protein
MKLHSITEINQNDIDQIGGGAALNAIGKTISNHPYITVFLSSVTTPIVLTGALIFTCAYMELVG